MKRQVFLPMMHEHPYFCFPESVGWYVNDKKHFVCREKNEMKNFNLHVVIAGKGYLKDGDVLYTLYQGDCFLYFPSEQQYYYTDEENPWEVLWIHFNGSCLKEFLIEQGFHSSKVWTLKIWTGIKEFIVELLQEAEKFTILRPTILSALTYKVIAEFISQAEMLTANRGADLYNKIIENLPRMREESYKPFSLEYWASQLYISTYYFCKMFKKATGMSPTKFIMLCRLQKSKQLLIEKRDWTIKQIALEVGYPSISYFGQLFLENEGLTPKEYRNKFI